ncbi:MAG: hypothetical protein CO042_01960 [Parcubacteria group bacterium CG_4_9_14_0_2_um_filter_41_8]|nr:MAG: hypothetical protein AUJ34_02065 [Parcubacteria group bacterium CG1_02_41_12]PIP67101.1 MAG: hypothetical protein COW93_02010 [Parcubacteria group bacterium CG22_combo_CG10-13_8_21_14_all_41_9]PIQ80382.1 MAG: hypothetical protein COV79_00760 [Parcubacteria group bacterium CG11_big_fil_rev_8_21_14_0_20_41_14]PIR56658.1 MAG: hypothetical protein COU72_05085 [Parcubacteria group bacterium CG10_big_fil_rev_8_21_14_0_10_41_35]PIZ79965.1 MAG: hypothetical protein COY02_03715 [Parcubacteria gr
MNFHKARGRALFRIPPFRANGGFFLVDFSLYEAYDISNMKHIFEKYIQSISSKFSHEETVKIETGRIMEEIDAEYLGTKVPKSHSNQQEG